MVIRKTIGRTFAKSGRKTPPKSAPSKEQFNKPLAFPVILNSSNIIALLASHPNFEGKFVFHTKTKEFSLGESQMAHIQIGQQTMANPDVFDRGGHPDIIGGTLSTKALPNKQCHEFKIVWGSSVYIRNKDISKAADQIKTFLETNGYIVEERMDDVNSNYPWISIKIKRS